MASETNDEMETWGRSSKVRLDELPHADPIAYLGTSRHPVSVPPISRDIEPPPDSMRDGAETASRSHAARRLLATAIGFAIVLPMAISLSTSDDVVKATAAAPRATLPAAQAVAQVVPRDLPPGGVAESVMPEAEPPLTTDKSMADWTSAPPVPTADAPKPSHVAAPVPPAPPESNKPANATAAPRPAAKNRSVGAFATPFDFTAAMNAIAAKSIGPSQCGLDAVGTTPVAITFAPSGQAIRAVVENGPLRGTTAGSCVALALRTTHIAPFDGDAATVRTTVLLR